MGGKKSLAKATFKELCALEYDHWNFGDWTIMTDASVVWISKQKAGENPTHHIEIPRHIFNCLITEYLKEKPFVRLVPR